MVVVGWCVDGWWWLGGVLMGDCVWVKNVNGWDGLVSGGCVDGGWKV